MAHSRMGRPVSSDSQCDLLYRPHYSLKSLKNHSAGSEVEVGGEGWGRRQCDEKHPWFVGGPRILVVKLALLNQMRLAISRLFFNRDSRCGTISWLPIKDDIEILVE